MRRLTTGIEDLPKPAQRTVVGTILLGTVLGASAVFGSFDDLSLLRIALIAVGIVAGEMSWVLLPHPHSSGVRLTFGDTATIAGILLASPGDLVLGITAGLLCWQLVDRSEPVKLVFNLAQYVAAGATAAWVMRAVSPELGFLGVEAVVGLLLAVAIFLILNTLAVATIVAKTANDALGAVARRVLPMNTIVTTGNGALALLLAVLLEHNPWVLPALAVPVLIVYIASRLRVAAQLDRERSEAALAVERRLGESVRRDDIVELLVEAVDDIVGLQGAVWLDGRWRTPIPEGSGPCTVTPDVGEIRWTQGDEFGPAIREVRCAAVGFGHGVLVAWEREAGSTSDVAPWLERLARSAVVHLSRAQASAALEQERATLRTVVDGTADGIFVLDDRSEVALWNPAMRRLSGISDEAVGQPIEVVLGQGPWTEQGIHDVPRTSEDSQEARVWRVAVASVHDELQPEPLIVAVVHDVTEERRVARMKDDMLAVVSHELRTPLTPIKASAQLLSRRADQLDPEQRTRLLSEIEQRADHLARLVEDLLLVAQLSSPTGSRPRVVPTTADLRDVVQQEANHLSEAYPDHSIELEGPPQLIGTTDALRLRQVVANLVDNACKYSPAGSKVLVRLTENGEDAVLEIIDEGRGIPPEDRDRIFERFHRLEDPMNMTTSGAGLGLFIVRALTTALGGSTKIEGGVGSGTTVTVRLPLLGVAENSVWGDEPILRR